MNYYNDSYFFRDRGTIIETRVSKPKGGKGDPNLLRNKANSKNRPKWMK